jgi:hypothetical protein
MIFGALLERYIPTIGQLLSTALKDPVLKVQSAGVKAYVSFVCNMEPNHQEPFKALAGDMLQVAIVACQQDQEIAVHVLQCMAEMAEIEPKFLRPVMPNVITQMMAIISAAALENDTRRLAVEVLIAICEEAPAMARKFPALPAQLIPQLIQFCAEIEDDPEWSKQDQDDIADEDDNSTLGEQSLDRIACALGGNVVLPETFKYVPTLLGDKTSWQRRTAALSTVAAIAEGCLDQMRGHLAQVVDAVVPCLLDPHPRVRYAACNAVGQLSLDYAPDPNKEHQMCFQTMFHAKVVPALLKMMEDNANPRVQAHGAAALVNFCEHTKGPTIQPYLNDILMRLGGMLQSGSRIVLEQTVTAIATVADSAEKHFQQYYPHFMPLLKGIMVSATKPEYRLLRGKTMECISLIGIAVGKAVFAQDAMEVMKLLFETQQTTMDPDDPQISYMLSAWARMCEILGQDFVPYLQHVMPPLLRSAKLEPKVMFLDAAFDEETLEGGRANWEVVPVADEKKIGIKTSALEEKRTACEMLKIYISQLKGNFGPFVPEVSQIMVGLLEFVFDEVVRSTAAACMAPLLESAANCAELRPKVPAMWQQFAPKLIEACNAETDLEVLSWQIEAIKDCMEVVGKALLPAEFLTQVAQGIHTWLDDYEGRYQGRVAEKQDQDYDDDADAALQEDERADVEIITQVAHLMHTLFAVIGTDFLPIWENLYPIFERMLPPTRPKADRQWALCVFDDLIEFCGPHSAKYAPVFGQAMIEYLKDTDPHVRQAATYGVGVMAQVDGDTYKAACTTAVATLFTVIQSPEAKKPPNGEATENAISSILKIVRNPTFMIPLTQVLPQILPLLPFTEDAEEAVYVYTYLCELIAKKDAAMTKPCQTMFLGIMADALHSPTMVPTFGNTFQLITESIRGMQAADGAAVGQMVAQLPADKQTKLQQAMAATPPPTSP